MAVGQPPLFDLPPVAGFRVAATAAGIKKNGRPDLLLVAMEPACVVAGCFTRNQVVAAPVTLCRERLAGGRAQALLVNSGNANVGYGALAMDNARLSAQAVAAALGVDEGAVFVSSTGVIAEPLPVARLTSAVPGLAAALRLDAWAEAATALMTTDTFPKGAVQTLELGGRLVTLAGIAKGAGMIHPDMATMLAYVFTDAAVTPSAWQGLLNAAVEESFNVISVDGDTSTNDTVLAFASGLAANPTVGDVASPDGRRLGEALLAVCRALALQIVRDGEGATKLAILTVTGAPSRAAAKQVAMAVARSPLVKTALFGQDPNIGRILAAVGYAGVPLDLKQLAIWVGPTRIVYQGERDPDYTEAQGQAAFQQVEIPIRIHLGQGDAAITVWTCDLSHDYVSINADYRS